MPDSIDIIRQRSELAHALPEVLGSDSAAQRWREDVITLLAKVDDLTNAATTAKNLLSRKQPHSVADVDGDAWEAWAVLKAALVSD
jgi:hypothetical protein